ncbi:Hypothetical protein R9X50_00505600 [Acrodontium crateriforme]|uniref:EamA domain-containing protein n=1 Tax=Acrodontium crateriforme TaxID=150365 RepID=A0AAQ3M8Y3_9PEZI|nr:Hypothetical protein R9X50_00505600 [Acrodontium crateriforme]
MSVRQKPEQADDDKVSLLSEQLDSNPPDLDRERGPKLERASRPRYESNGFLAAPLHGPIRPLSPDTLSNYSLDDYNQFRSGPPEPVNLLYRSSLSDVSSRPGWRRGLEAFWVRNKGLALMLLAQVFGTMMNVTTRLLEIEGNKGKGLHPFQILFARMGITFVLASGYMCWKTIPNFPLGAPEVRWLLAARGFGGFFGVFGMYYSLLYLPLADATVITFLAPGLACWACSILINEPFTRVERIGGLVSLVGVVLIARPTSLFAAFHSSTTPPTAGNDDAVPMTNTTTSPTDADASSYESVSPTQRLGAVCIALVGVLGSATAYTTIRWIGKRAHPLISVNYFSGWTFLVSIVMQAALPGVGFLLPAEPKEWGYLLFLGACGFIMQFLLAAGLSYEKSSRATNITYTQMLFALGFDKLIFGHTPGITSIIGSSLILGSAIVVALQKGAGQATDQSGSSRLARDEESQRGLISGIDNENGDSHEQLPVQEVQLRTLR